MRARLRAYGLTVEAYESLLASQEGKCAICQTTAIKGAGKRLAIDHCHASGKVRGILCGNCNRGLGHFDHNPDLLRAAITYLKE
jgi:hypothetical protein